MSIEYLELPPAGEWFALDVVRQEACRRDWVVLMIDVNPDDLKTCACDFPALFYVHPDEYQPGERKAQQRWVRIPGKHKNKDAAWEAVENMLATRH